LTGFAGKQISNTEREKKVKGKTKKTFLPPAFSSLSLCKASARGKHERKMTAAAAVAVAANQSVNIFLAKMSRRPLKEIIFLFSQAGNKNLMEGKRQQFDAKDSIPRDL
jgi:hypothetical protein